MSKTIFLSGLKYIYCELTRVSALRESWGVYYPKELHEANSSPHTTQYTHLSTDDATSEFSDDLKLIKSRIFEGFEIFFLCERCRRLFKIL